VSEDKYGKVLDAIIVAQDSNSPVRVAIIEQRGRVWLDIRSMYYKDAELRFGKGVRIEVDEDTAEEAILAAQAMLEKYL